MEAKITKLKDQQIEINFEIPWQEFKDFKDRATGEISKEINLNGFRAGKAPKEMIEKEVSETKILEEAANLAVREEYPKFILQNQIEIIGIIIE